jgi:hypothetical protein
VLDKALRKMEEEVLPKLKESENILGTSEEFTLIANTVSQLLRSISILLHNNYNDFERSVDALKKARASCHEKELLQQIDNDLVQVLTNRRSRRGRKQDYVFKVFVFVALAAFMIGYLIWDEKHATLYIDNGTKQELNLVFKEWKTISVQPGLRIVEIPVGTYEVVCAGKTSRLAITNGRTWVFNPKRINHYRRQQVFYGSVQGEPQAWEIGNPELVEADAYYVLESSPERIKTKLSGEIRTVFERVTTLSGQNELGIPMSSTGASGIREFSRDTRKEDIRVEIDAAAKELSDLDVQLKALKNNLDSYKAQIEVCAAEIDRAEENVSDGDAIGYSIDQEALETLIKRHNHYVELHNAELKRYNVKHVEYQKLLNKTKARIDEYYRR